MNTLELPINIPTKIKINFDDQLAQKLVDEWFIENKEFLLKRISFFAQSFLDNEMERLVKKELHEIIGKEVFRIVDLDIIRRVVKKELSQAVKQAVKDAVQD